MTHGVREGGSQVIAVPVLIGARRCLLVHIVVKYIQFQILGNHRVRYRKDGHIPFVVFTQGPHVLLQLQIHPVNLFRQSEAPHGSHFAAVFPGDGRRGESGDKEKSDER